MPKISPDYWENFVAIIAAFALLALIIERALYQIFDTKLWKKMENSLDEQAGGDYFDLKPWISAIVSIVIVYRLNLDMVAMIYKADRTHNISLIVTGLFLSGGSTGIYKFFKRARKLKEKITEKEATESIGDAPS